MIHILQINMHWGATAHELLAQCAVDIKVDLVLISEQGQKNHPAFGAPTYQVPLPSGFGSPTLGFLNRR